MSQVMQRAETPKNFWEHYCVEEKSVVGTEILHECNWCGKRQDDANVTEKASDDAA